MYGWSEVRRAIDRPHLIWRELNRLYHSRLGQWDYNRDGMDVFDEDWDNLVILDACRYDVFEERASLPGRLEKRQSRGAATSEFVRANFTDRRLYDTVYVTGNSWYFKLREEIEADVFATYDVVDNPDRRKTDRLTERALDAVADYPDKRLVVHYIPPHHPFVGPTADEYLPPYEQQQSDLFERVLSGDLEIADETLRQAYRENLDRVLPHVERLLDELPGKTVVTADHGELIGDRSSPVPVREYGHHTRLYVDELVEIPWFVHDTGERRQIRSERPESDRQTPDPSGVDEHLRDLGYAV